MECGVGFYRRDAERVAFAVWSLGGLENERRNWGEAPDPPHTPKLRNSQQRKQLSLRLCVSAFKFRGSGGIPPDTTFSTLLHGLIPTPSPRLCVSAFKFHSSNLPTFTNLHQPSLFHLSTFCEPRNAFPEDSQVSVRDALCLGVKNLCLSERDRCSSRRRAKRRSARLDTALSEARGISRRGVDNLFGRGAFSHFTLGSTSSVFT